MAKPREPIGKKEIRNKQEQKRKEKMARRLDKRERNGNNLDEMIAYVDEFGQISETPPDPNQRIEINPADIQIGVPRQIAPTAEQLAGRHTGSVAFFDDVKGFGFINDHIDNSSVFVHINHLSIPVYSGDIVEFEIVNSGRGPAAIQVTLISRETETPEFPIINDPI
jgi:cold shock CspA family protein